MYMDSLRKVGQPSPRTRQYTNKPRQSDVHRAFLKKKARENSPADARLASGQESFFALPERSGLADYMHTMQVSVKEQAGHLFERTASASDDVQQSFSRRSYGDDDSFAVGALQNSVRQPVSAARSLFGVVTLIVVASALFGMTNLTAISVGFWLFFVSMFFWRIDARIAIGLALISLVLVVVLLILAQTFGHSSPESGLRYWAEQSAVWAYLFLVIGVVRQVWEYALRRS
jgi:ABC-type multidrug transport system fused ATPase/permease subunit